jgi:hypothetical protein
MAISPKTIYLEPDEEITSVIDKIRKTEFADIVLVVPKGASISQSVVNLKLIKKKAEELSKSISLVTGDKVARTLADKIGIPVASSIAGLGVTKQPVVESAGNEGEPLLSTNEVIFNKEPVESEPGELSVREDEDVEAEVEDKEDMLEKVEEEKPAKPKNLLPKFPWLKVGLFVGVPILILLIAAYIYLPQAKANIFMKAASQPVSIDFIGQPNAQVDTNKEIVPTQTIDVTKDSTKTFPATGQKDEGNEATGTVRITTTGNLDWVSGTRLYLSSNSGLVYTMNSEAAISGGGSVVIGITAQGPGTQYNIPTNSPILAVNDPNNPADVRVQTAVTGGTSKTVTYVTQGDFDAAKDSLSKDTTNDATSDFTSQTANLKVIDSTKQTNVVSATANPDVGQDGSSFSLTVKVEIKALAVSDSDLGKLVTTDVSGSLGNAKTVIDDGSTNVNFQIDNADITTGKVSGTLTTTAYVANKLDQNAVKTQLEGLNDAQAVNYLKGLDGVSDVQNSYFPPFLRSFPRIKEHIILNIQVDNSSRSS